MANTKPSSLSTWLLAIRPKTLPAAAAPVTVAAAAAYVEEGFLLIPALLCLLGALLLQIGVNLANDYFDCKNEIDSDKRQGPLRVTQSGLLSPETVKRAMYLALFLAALVFCGLFMIGGWPIAVIAIFSIAAALAYSGGPYPLASHGLGEVFVFIFFGLVAVCGTYYLQTGTLSWLALVCSLPPGLLVSAIMVVNNLRDIDTDKEAGKITLAVRLGRYKTILLYKALVYGTYLVPIILVISGVVGPFILLPMGTLPMAYTLSLKIECDLGYNLNENLAGTARLSLVFCLLFACGMVFTF